MARVLPKIAVACVMGLLLAGAASATAPPAGALVNGRTTPVGLYPWTVSILVDVAGSKTGNCSGALIAPTWVLTAAHCVNRTRQDTVHTGSWDYKAGGQDIAIAAMFTHPGYDNSPPAKYFESNDVALLQLVSPSPAPTIALPRPDQAASWLPGTTAHFAGFGVSCNIDTDLPAYQAPFCPGCPCPGNFSAVLSTMHDAALPVIDTATCAAAYPNLVVDAAIELCTGVPGGNVSPCPGDSGGSLFAVTPDGPVTIGVISGGKDPCGSPDGPAVYARVTAFLDWITSVSGVAPPPSSTTTTTTTTPSPTTTPPPAVRATTANAVTVTPRFTG